MKYFENPVRQRIKRSMQRFLPRAAFITTGPSTGNGWFLSFDDGPHPDFTPGVLDVLARCDARATFFVVGKLALREPELVRRIVREGHALGHHSFEHLQPERCSSARLALEVLRTRRLLRDVTGLEPRLFRPPFGKLSPGKLLGLWAQRQTVTLWNVDPRDYDSQSSQELVEWFDVHKPAAGDLVLLHDNHPHLAPALPEILSRVRALGLVPRGL